MYLPLCYNISFRCYLRCYLRCSCCCYLTIMLESRNFNKNIFVVPHQLTAVSEINLTVIYRPLQLGINHPIYDLDDPIYLRLMSLYKNNFHHHIWVFHEPKHRIQRILIPPIDITQRATSAEPLIFSIKQIWIEAIL